MRHKLKTGKKVKILEEEPVELSQDLFFFFRPGHWNIGNLLLGAGVEGRIQA